MGVTEADRQRIVDELQRRSAQGRLTAPELADRIRRARTVVTLAGLDGILLDLPDAGPASPSSRPWALPGAGPEPERPPAPGPAPASAPSGFAPAPFDGGPGHPRRRRPGSQVAVGVVAVALVVLGVVVAQQGSGSPESAAPAPTISSTTATSPTSTTSPTTTAAPAPPPTEGPADPLVLEVGSDIQPGVYTTAPADRACWWQRFGAGDPNFVVAEDRSVRPLVEVLPTDTRLRLRGCDTLVPYAPPATPAISLGDGDWLVGQDIAPGRYQVTAPDPDSISNCTWSRALGFGYAQSDLIDIRDAYGGDIRTETVVEVGERFSTSGCGTWTLR